jgi:hypothetical protein
MDLLRLAQPHLTVEQRAREYQSSHGTERVAEKNGIKPVNNDYEEDSNMPY